MSQREGDSGTHTQRKSQRKLLSFPHSLPLSACASEAFAAEAEAGSSQRMRMSMRERERENGNRDTRRDERGRLPGVGPALPLSLCLHSQLHKRCRSEGRETGHTLLSFLTHTRSHPNIAGDDRWLEQQRALNHLRHMQAVNGLMLDACRMTTFSSKEIEKKLMLLQEFQV